MKINNLNPSLTEHKSSSTKDINNISYEITKRLLEKYKPKVNQDIENIEAVKERGERG